MLSSTKRYRERIVKVAKTNHDYLRERAFRRAGLIGPIQTNLTPDEIASMQLPERFLELIRNRVVMGYLRYESLDRSGKVRKYDRVKSAIERLEEFKKDGNLEHVVDAAALLWREFAKPSNPNARFRAMDDGPHTKEVT